MAFNVYEWRRNQLLTESSIHPDPKDLTTNPEADIKQYREQLFQRLLKDLGDNPKAIEIIKRQMGDINENEDSSSVIVKKIKDLTWEDVDGLALPTKTSGVLRAMKATKDLDSWKNEFKGNELELEVTVDKGADMWFNKVKIEKLTQSDPMGFQAKIDAKKGKKSGLDEIEGDPDDYYGYNEPYDHSVEADDFGYNNDKVAFVADALQVAWNMGKGNNELDFEDMARSTVKDLETRF
jgi:hypothetical protein